jgi:hypothetical protein
MVDPRGLVLVEELEHVPVRIQLVVAEEIADGVGVSPVGGHAVVHDQPERPGTIDLGRKIRGRERRKV